MDRDDQLIPIEGVMSAYGIKRATVWKWVAEQRIPAPVVNGNRYARWSNNDVQDHIAALKEKARKEAAR